MKHLILIPAIFLLLLSSCKKGILINSQIDYLGRVKETLKDSMNSEDFIKADFSRAFKTSIDSEKLILLRVPFFGKDFSTGFILIQTDISGNCLRGRIIELQGNVSESMNYNGNIQILSLKANELVKSSIIDGYIEAFSPPKNKEPLQLEPVQPYIPQLPEVIVTGYIPSSGGGISFSTYVNLMSFFNNSGGSGSGGGGGSTYGDPTYGGWYAILPQGGGGPGGGLGGSGGGGSNLSETENAIYIDFEQQYIDPAIDILKYINCFNSIPDAGASCKITIFTDIPVNGDPTKFFDWKNGSPGHTFIQFQKVNGSQQVSQNMGFYPASGWKTAVSPAPIEGKFVDNHHHEFNASYEKTITPSQLQSGLLEIMQRRNMRYDIDDNNCTDWAIAVFNATLAGQEDLEIPLYNIPGGEAPYGTSTPQGLYNKLREMQNAGGPQAQGIVIPIIGWVGASSGPCN